MRRLPARAGVAAPLSALAGWLGTALLAAADSPPVRPLAIEDAVLASSFHVQGRPAFSPDGRWLAYTVCDPRRIRVDPEDKEGRFATKGAAYRSMGCDLWVSSVPEGKARNLTEKNGNNWGPTWSPDGRLLVFYSDRGGRPQLWSWDVRTARSRLVSPAETRTFFGFDLPAWTPDSRRLIARLRPEGMTDEELDESAPAPSPGPADPKEAGSTVVVYRSEPARPKKDEAPATSGLPVKTALCDLSEIEVATGRVRRFGKRVYSMGFWVSPDGSRLAYLEMKGRKSAASVSWLYDLVVRELTTGKSRIAVAGIEQGFGRSVSWSPDGRRLAYFSGALYRPADCFVVSADGGSPRKLERAKQTEKAQAADAQASDLLAPLWDESGKSVYVVDGNSVWRGDVAAGRLTALTADLGARLFEIVQSADGHRIWSPDGKSLIVSRRDEKSKRGLFLRVEIEGGRVTSLLDEPKSYGRFFDTPLVSPDGRHVAYFAESVREPPDLWIAGPGFREPRRLTTINPQLERYEFGTSRLLEFTNADGKALHAALLLPADYEKGKRYPTLVFVYPQDWGSESVHDFGLGGIAAYNLHMLSTRGYAVLQPDAPVGKGSIMRDLLKSVMPAIDEAVRLGVVDPDRLAVTGQSGGGYATLAIVAQTTRFKAAIMNAGFGDLTGFYGSMNLSTGDGNWIPWLESLTGGMGAGPWDAAQTFVQNSPVYFLNRVETPMIIQAGSADSAIVPFSDQVFVGLKRLGKDVTYLRYAGEGHVLAARSNLVDYWKRVTKFLDQHLRDGKSLDELAQKAHGPSR